MNTFLNKTRNYFRVIGTYDENGLKRETCKIKLRDENGNDAGTVDGERIMGNIAIKTKTGIVMLNVYFQNLTSKNETNPQWKMACDMYENWVPRINGTGEPTVVNVEGTIAPNDYVGQDGSLKYTLRWSVRRANTKIPENAVYGASLNAVGYIQSISHEIRNEEETGRLLVKLYGVDNQGACFPIDAIVEKDMADDFESSYEPQQTVNFDFDLVIKHIGEKKGGKKAFGKQSTVAVNDGFDIQELIIVGGDEPFEEPDEEVDEEGNPVKTQWINPSAMKKALKERDKYLDQLKAIPPEKKSTKSTSIKDQKAKFNKVKANTAPTFEDFDDEEDPF